MGEMRTFFPDVKTKPCVLFQSGPVALQWHQQPSNIAGSGQKRRPGLIPQKVQYEGDTASSQGAPV